MSRIDWNDALSVGNDEIDGQHKTWIEIHNRLHDVLENGRMDRIDAIGEETLHAMLEYTRFHFKFEEEYMRQIGYPGLVDHRRLHKDFDTRIYTLYREIRAGQIVLNSALITTLRDWLHGHILHEDKKYCRFQHDASC